MHTRYSMLLLNLTKSYRKRYGTTRKKEKKLQYTTKHVNDKTTKNKSDALEKK